MRLAGRDRVVHGGHRRARHGGRRAASSARLMPSCGRPSDGIWQWPVSKCRGIGSDAERSLSKDRPRPIPIAEASAVPAPTHAYGRTPASRSCGHRCRRFLVVGDAFLFITCCWQSSDRTSRYGRHPQWGDQLAALFAIERRNSELAKQAEPGCLAEVYRKIVEMDGSSQRRRPVSGLDEVLTIEAIKIALFAIAALFSRLARSGASSLRPVGSS